MSETWRDRCLERGTSILLAAVDQKGVPSCCRGIAVHSEDGFRTMTVYVPMATSRETIASIAATRRLAVSVTQPLDHHSVQLKGTTTNVRLAQNEEQQLVERRLFEFADVLHEIGLPRRIARTITHWPAFAIEMRVDQVFEQTPGPKAGVPLS